MSRYEHKLFSIMGDSISTYAYYVPCGYPSFYSRTKAFLTDVPSARETWWGRVLAHVGGELLVNNSWSGSDVCRSPETQIESYGCSDARCALLGEDGRVPDHIFVFIGANDRGRRYPTEAEETESTDLSVFPNAYRAMLDKLRRNYPAAELWCITLPRAVCTRDPYWTLPAVLSDEWTARYNRVITAAAEERGCHLIDLFAHAPVDTCDGLHPDGSGMQTIAEAVIAALEREAD